LKHRDVNVTAICDAAEFWDNSGVYHRHNGGRGPATRLLKQFYRERGSGDREFGVYVDYRVMLEKIKKDIDGVVVATPNHTHAVTSLAAIRLGKGVYCEKPLTHSVYETRRLVEAAREAKVATQMGNQGHSSDDIRNAVEWIRAGGIGTVREVHGWRGGPRRMKLNARPTETPPLPKGLDWDLWLGPARVRPFHPAYATLLFHYWWDFGSGTLGNFGCHTLDTAVWALDLKWPTYIEASSTELYDEAVPEGTVYHYRFPARGDQPPVDLYWYDGGLMPPRPDCLEPGKELPREGGSLIVGDKGAILSDNWSGSPRIIPEKRDREFERPRPTLRRSKGPYREWLDALKGGAPASSNFDNAAGLAEIVLLGKVALRTGATIYWDGPAMKAVNAPQADQYIRGYHRKGWEV
jgi:predicted dehydrogenase